MAANRSAIIGDLLKNSGIVRSRTNQYGTTLRVSNLCFLDVDVQQEACIPAGTLVRLCSSISSMGGGSLMETL